MSELILNVSFAVGGPPPRRPPAGNRRHRSFVRRRRLLERLGALKEKQLPPNARRQPRGDPKKPGACGGGRPRGGGGGREGTKWRRPPSGGGAAPEKGAPKGPGGGLKGSGGSPKGSGGPPKGSGGPKGSGPPPKSSGAPPKASGAPLKGSGPSSKGSGPPPKGSGAPLKASGAPLKASGPPPKASGPPLKASGPPPAPCKLVAIDCEMVGTGPGGRTSALARCSIVGYEGDVLYDHYVRPTEPVVDYRTRWSGVRRQHLANAVPFSKAQREIVRLLSGKVVVGHAIHNDFKALKYCHPKALTRDTSKIPLLNRRGGFPEGVSVSLKRLAKELLHRDIQVGKSGHSSVEDARATMELYRVVEAEWEQHLALNPEQQ